jgi:hypothetical protein
MRPHVLPAVFAVLAFAALAACRDEAHPPPAAAVEPPVASPEAIPDAPVSGRVHGAPFVLRDARYVEDRRPGYGHTDIVLSTGAAETTCAPVSPGTSTSVWLRLEGAGRIQSANVRAGPGAATPWSVHYQVFDGGAWLGVGEGSALVTLHEPGPDGRIAGGIAVCFPDESKSCVSGSFDAVACPPRIDQAVRGTLPPEAIPPEYQKRVLDGGRP